jgi:hypothetical protein
MPMALKPLKLALAVTKVGSAQYILGPFAPDTDLRRYGLRLCERGGKNAKKRAALAVARKLAVLLRPTQSADRSTATRVA